MEMTEVTFNESAAKRIDRERYVEKFLECLPEMPDGKRGDEIKIDIVMIAMKAVAVAVFGAAFGLLGTLTGSFDGYGIRGFWAFILFVALTLIVLIFNAWTAYDYTLDLFKEEKRLYRELPDWVKNDAPYRKRKERAAKEDANYEKFERDVVSSFVGDVVDDGIIEYLKGVIGERAQVKRRKICTWLGLLFPVLTFAVGMALLWSGNGAAAFIVYPFGVFAGWIVPTVGSNHFENLKKMLAIRMYVCSSCHRVTMKFEHEGSEYGDVEDYTELVKSETHSETVGTVYIDGKEAGSVSRTVTSNTYESGQRQRETAVYRCPFCGSKKSGESRTRCFNKRTF